MEYQSNNIDDTDEHNDISPLTETLQSHSPTHRQRLNHSQTQNLKHSQTVRQTDQDWNTQPVRDIDKHWNTV